MLQAALGYLQKGKSVMPLKKDKRPLLPEWRQYQTQYPTEDEVKEWWTKYPDANIGLITGKISGITVIDIDTQHGGTTDGLPLTLASRTGNGGWHFFYKYEEGITVGAGIRQGIDVRGDGGYIVAPPSITEYTDKDGQKKGGEYEFVIVEELAPFPTDIFPLQKPKIEWEKLLSGVSQGERNMTAARIAGKLIGVLPKAEWESVAWALLRLWNKNNTPPDDEKSLRRTFESVLKRHLLNHQEEKDEEIKIVPMSEAAKMKPSEALIPTGLDWLDTPMCGGISKGSTVVIAAPSGQGKTALLVTISAGLMRKNTKCLWFSYEETVAEVWARFTNAGFGDEALSFCPLDLADHKIDYIEKVIHKQKENEDFFVVFIDQLSFLAPKIKGDKLEGIEKNYSLFLGLIANQLKNLAMENNIIIVYAHQLGRSGELSHSEMVKHAASKALFLRREENGDKDAQEEYTDNTFLTFKKNRVVGGAKNPRMCLKMKDGLFEPKEWVSPQIAYAQKKMGGVFL